MSGLAKAFLVSALVAVASPAAAVEIRVSATIVRPIWERSGVRDRQMRSVLRWVPASHQLVHVYQPRRPIGKIYCGSAWTDSNGRVYCIAAFLQCIDPNLGCEFLS